VLNHSGLTGRFYRHPTNTWKMNWKQTIRQTKPRRKHDVIKQRSPFCLPNNTTACTSTSVQFRRAGQQGPTRTLTAALKNMERFTNMSVVQTANEPHRCCQLSNKVENIKRILDIPYTLQWFRRHPQNCPVPYRDPGPHLIHGSLGPPEFIT